MVPTELKRLGEKDNSIPNLPADGERTGHLTTVITLPQTLRIWKSEF